MMFNMKIALLAFGLVLLAIKDVNADDCGWRKQKNKIDVPFQSFYQSNFVTEAEYAKKFLACRNTCSHDAMNALVKKGGMSGDDAQNIESW